MPTAAGFLLIGWEGADWPLINPLLDDGGLPFLSRLIERGAAGRLARAEPPVMEAWWTTLATGRSADEHGIAAALERDPASGGARPVMGTSRRVKALWNILSQSGWRVGVVGFPVTHPAEPIRGVLASEAFARPVAPVGEPWPIAPTSLHPREMAADLASMRVHPGELRSEDLLPFIPTATRCPPRRDGRLAALAGMVAENASRQAVASWLLESHAVDALLVHFNMIGAARRLLAPRPNGGPDEAVYADVVTGALRFHDLMLGRLMALAGPEATVMLVSPGAMSARTPASGGERQRMHDGGLICLAGSGVRADQLSLGAGLLDVVPTALAMLGLPTAEDMPGRVLAEVAPRPAVSRIESWETLPGECGLHVPDSAPERQFAAVAIAELAVLGYRDAVAPVAAVQAADAQAAQAGGRAQAAWARGHTEAAIRLCEQGLETSPSDMSLRILLAQFCYQNGDLARCRELVAGFTALADDPPLAHFVDALLALAAGEVESGCAHLAAIEPLPVSVELLGAVARAYLNAGRPGDAERVCRLALATEAESPQAHAELARALLAQRKSGAAAAAAEQAIHLDFHAPEAHFLLGMALAEQGELVRARQALAVSLRLAPGRDATRAALAAIDGIAA